MSGRTRSGARSVGPCSSSLIRMSLIRCEQALDADPALGAGEWAAGTGVDAAAERQVLARVAAVEPELVRVLELARVAVGGAVDHHHGRAGGMSTPPTVVGTRASRKSPFTGLS